MHGMAGIAERAVLLAQAIELGSSLAAVLDKIGPSRFVAREGDEKLLEISTLEETLHCKLQWVSVHRNSALAPVSRLPDDVLSYIFTVASATTAEKPALRLAAILSWVCRRWRAVAVDTAKLWAFVTRPIKHAYDRYNALIRRSENRAARVPHPWYDLEEFAANEVIEQVMFARSKRAPLNVSLTVSEERDLDAAKALLTSWPERVDKLSIQFVPNDKLASASVPDSLVSWIIATRSSLRSLTLNLGYPDASGRPEFRGLFDKILDTDMPLLTDIHVVHLALPTPTELTFSCVLRCKRMSLFLYHTVAARHHGLALLLRSSPQLQELSITLASNVPTLPMQTDSTMVRLPHLTNLSISGRGIIPILLMGLKAPGLVNLSLRPDFASAYGETVKSLSSALVSFLEVSGTPAASITTVDVPAQSLLEALPFLPDVRRISFSWCCTKNEQEYFDLLQGNVSPLGANLCPHLEELCFPHLTATESLGRLQQIFQTRRLDQRDVGKQIARLQVGFDQRPPVDSVETRVREKQIAEEVGELVVEHSLGPRWTFDKGTGTWMRSTTRSL